MSKKFNWKASNGSPDRTLDIHPKGTRGSRLKKVQPKTSPAEVPILIYGDNNNFPVFQQVLSMVALEKWENSARVISVRAHEIDPGDYDLEHDPHKLNLWMNSARQSSVGTRLSRILLNIVLLLGRWCAGLQPPTICAAMH
jgi:hypothetical protein